MRRTLCGGVAALALVGAGLASAMPTASAAEVWASGSDDCVGGGSSSARVAEGGDIRSEPGHLTGQQAAAREARLVKRLRNMGYTDKASTPRLQDGSVRIRVHVHVITRRDGTGDTTKRQVGRQIDVINKGFRGAGTKAGVNTPFRFRLASLDRTAKTAWYNWRFEKDDKPAKRALHQGSFNDLNIYIADLGNTLLGYAFYPTANEDRLFRDGLVVNKESLPGGSFDPYGRGDTATHEIGHWMNLQHTFEGGCKGRGDYVEDTPRQEAGVNVFSCNKRLNTCGGDGRNALLDPVHNFMNYTDDKCVDRFTRGQEDRMELSWLAYRAGK